MTPSFRDKVLHSVKWSFIGIALQRAMEPLLVLVLARLLSPADFGIMAIAASIIAFGRQLQSMGLSQALIQSEENVDDVCDAVFWLNLMFGLFLFCILQALAPSFGVFFRDERIVEVTRLIAFMLIIIPFDGVQEAILRREFAFKKLVKRRLIPLLVQAAVSMPLALLGFSYWALVWGVLARSVTGVITLWSISSWRPHFRIKWPIARQKLGFGVMVTLGVLQGWMIIQGDRLFAGRAFGVEGLGAYDFGANLVNLMALLICEPVFGVAYSAFSRQQKDIQGVVKTYHDFVYGVSFLLLPVMVGLALTAPIAVPLFFRSKWNASITVIGVLALMLGPARVLYLNSYLYKALNRPDIEPKLNLFKMLYLIPAYLIAMQLDLKGFSIIRGSLAITFWIPDLLIARKLLGKPQGFFWKVFIRPLGASFIMGIVLLFMQLVLKPYGHPALILAGMITVGSLVYVGIILLIDRRALRLLKQAIISFKNFKMKRRVNDEF